MSAKLVDFFLIFFLLVCGMGSFLVLSEISNLSESYTLDALIACGCRTLSLIFYRFYTPQVRGNMSWLVFEWLIPGVLMAEAILVACGSALAAASARGDGELLITNFGLFNSNLFDT